MRSGRRKVSSRLSYFRLEETFESTPLGLADLSNQAVHMPLPKDILPSMVTVMELLVQFTSDHPHLFQRRGETDEEQIRNMEADQAALEFVLMSLVEGSTWMEQAWQIFKLVFRKSDLVKTLQAVDHFQDRLHAIGNDPAKLLQSERLCHFRQCTMASWTGEQTENIFHAVTLKLYQLVWFTNWVYMDKTSIHRWMHQPPNDNCMNLAWLRRDTQLRDSMKIDLYEEDEELLQSAVLPMHPMWLSHNVPFGDSPSVTIVNGTLAAATLHDPDIWSARMSFCRSVIARLEGSLKSQLEIVSSIQIRVLGFAIAVLPQLWPWIAKNSTFASTWNSTARHFDSVELIH